jgi:O-antigen/teichoic acid export membrane protein
MMVAGAAISAIGAYLFQVIGGRALGATAFAAVSVMWTVLFLGFTVFLMPVEQLVIRRVTLAGGAVGGIRGSMGVVVAAVGAVSVGSVAFAAATRSALLGGDAGYITLTAVMFPVYGVYAVGRGLLAGTGRYAAYGAVVAAESAVRVAGAAVVAVTGRGGVALVAALIVSPLVVGAARPWRGGAAPPVEGFSPGSDRRFLSGYIVATAASQTILAAGPLVVGALGASAASISVFFMTTTLFRGPVSASTNLVARLLPSVTRRSAGGGDAALNRLVVRGLLVGSPAAVAVGAAAAVVGPWVVQVLYGADFRPSPELAGLSAAAVVAGLVALLVSQVLVGRGHTGRLAIVWVVALAAAAVVVVASTGDEAIRVALAFLVGETTALVGLVVAALRGGGPRRAGRWTGHGE